MVNPIGGAADRPGDAMPVYDDETAYQPRAVLAGGPPRRDVPGLIAWTQRAYYRPGHQALTARGALRGLILWPVAATAWTYAVLAVKVPLIVTPSAVTQAMHAHLHPGATDHLLRAAMGMTMVIFAAVTTGSTIDVYGRARPVSPATPSSKRGQPFPDSGPPR